MPGIKYRITNIVEGLVRRRRRSIMTTTTTTMAAAPQKGQENREEEGILVCIGRYLRDMCSCLSLDVDEVTRRLLLRQVGCICLAFRIC
jgi:hypothetical protein